MKNKQNRKIQALKQKPTPPKLFADGGKLSVPSWAITVVLVFTFLLYSRALFNNFVYLDDDQYILTNPFLRDFSFKGVWAIFSSFYFSNYHPLTTLTFFFEYSLFGTNPFPYHLFNLLLHLLNIWLVYKLVEKLSGTRICALVAALLFGIHPMHVESVAWISERKDVLYACFYLSSLMVYLRYLETGHRIKFYLGSLSLFLFSLLSKSAAVTLPVLLVAIDIYKDRKINIKSILEKIPFFILSLVFGILTILSQKSGGAINDFSSAYDILDRFFIIVYSIAFYVVKLIAPVNLSAMYYYPISDGGALPLQYYFSLPFILVIGWLLFKTKSFRKEAMFGVLFFLIAISVMLQFVTFGYALTAERYTYISYIGFFYIAGQAMSNIEKNRILKIATILFSFFVFVFTIQTWNRIGAWKNGDVLINDVIEKNPTIYDGYWTRANLKNTKGDLQGALIDFDKVIEYRPDFASGHRMRGDIRLKLGDYEGAIEDLDRAISLDPTIAEAYNIRGNAYYKSGNLKSAFLDCDKALELNPKLVEAYNNRCMLKAISGDTAGAMADINKSIELSPNNADSYSNRANIKVMMKNFKDALDDFNHSLKLNPDNGMVYFNRGISRLNLNDNAGACEDWKRAMELGNNAASQLIGQYCH